MFSLNATNNTVMVNDGLQKPFELKTGDKIFLRNMLWGHTDNPDYKATVGEDLQDFILAMNTTYQHYSVSKIDK